MRRALSLVVLVALAVSGCSGGATRSRWERLNDIAYVLPSHLPAGWTVALAREEPGRPIDKWDSQSELYTSKARDEVLIIAALLAERGKATKPGLPKAEPEFSPPFVLGYALDDDVDVDELKALRTTWRSATLELAVLHFARRPSPELVRNVAAKVEDETRLGFTAPAKIAPGFTYVGSGAPAEVTEYSIEFATNRYAGKSRKEAQALMDDAPTISIHVAAYFYAQWPGLRDFAAASKERDTDSDGSISFVFEDSLVRVWSRDVSRRELLAVAKSISRHSRDDWRKRLGDRLRISGLP